MAYSKQTWANGSAGGTPITGPRLSHMEDGIEDAAAKADGAVPASTVTAAGDLLVGTDDATVDRLGIGTEGQVLTVSDDGVPEWADATGGGGGSGDGDVTGPDSSTDGHLAVFDGTTGKSIKDGGAPFSGSYDDLSDTPTLGSAAAEDTTAFATAAQGGLADSATQPGDLATVATSGAYSDLSGTPSIPDSPDDIGAVPTSRKINGHDLTADRDLTPADVGAATAAQGALADTATQPGDLAAVATSGSYDDLSDLPTLGTAAAQNLATGDTPPSSPTDGDIWLDTSGV